MLQLKTNGKMTDIEFNQRMDTFKEKGCHFKSTDFQPFAKRESGLPQDYFLPSLWESLKRMVGLL